MYRGACVKKCVKIRDVISKGCRSVCCNNGTEILLPDVGLTYDAISPPKRIGGVFVYRWIYCRIPYWVDTSEIEKYFFEEVGNYNEFILPEREMNSFIQSNGGIDEYRTFYWVVELKGR